MRFSRYLAPVALLTTTGAFAAPNPEAAPAPAPAPMPEPQLGGLAEFGDTLRALTNLLSGDTLNNIVSIVDNGAALLTPQFVNQTQTLISTVNAALPALAGLLGNLGGTASAAPAGAAPPA